MKYRSALAWPLLFLALYFVYCQIFGPTPHNSDCASGYLRSLDASRGNWLLLGWRLPLDTFYTTDLWVQVLLIRLFGDQGEHMTRSAAILWAAVVIASLVLSARGLNGRPRWLTLATTFMLVGLPFMWGEGAPTVLAKSYIHIGSYAYILAGYAALQRGTPLAYLMASACAVLSIAGDPMVYVVGWIPAFLAYLSFGWLQPAERKVSWSKALFVAASILLGVLCRMMLAKVGMEPDHYPMKFVRFQDWGHTFSSLLSYHFIFFGAWVFGRPASADQLLDLAGCALRIPFLLFTLILVGRLTITLLKNLEASCRKNFQNELSELDHLLLCATLISGAALVFAANVRSYEEHRYFVPTYLYMAILAARFLPQVTSLCLLLPVSIGVSLLLYGRFLWVHRSQPIAVVEGTIHQAIHELTLRGLSEGLAEYWDSHRLQAASQGRLHPRTVLANEEGHLHAYPWQSKFSDYALDSWKSPRFFFLVTPGSRLAGMSSSSIIREMGPPQEHQKIDQIEILVYPKQHPILEQLAQEASQEAAQRRK